LRFQGSSGSRFPDASGYRDGNHFYDGNHGCGLRCGFPQDFRLQNSPIIHQERESPAVLSREDPLGVFSRMVAQRVSTASDDALGLGSSKRGLGLAVHCVSQLSGSAV
jgi:hypothetical protein